jgi:hypothetical protein
MIEIDSLSLFSSENINWRFEYKCAILKIIVRWTFYFDIHVYSFLQLEFFKIIFYTNIFVDWLNDLFKNIEPLKRFGRCR